MLSRLLYARRTSLLVGALATALSTALGVVLGLISGYFGGVADMVIMRVTDMVMSFPYLLLVLVAAAIFEPGLWNIILILGFVDWPGVPVWCAATCSPARERLCPRQPRWRACPGAISSSPRFCPIPSPPCWSTQPR